MTSEVNAALSSYARVYVCTIAFPLQRVPPDSRAFPVIGKNDSGRSQVEARDNRVKQDPSRSGCDRERRKEAIHP